MSNAIVRAEGATDTRLALEPKDWSEARELAKIAVASKYFSVKSPEEALVILLTGRELGLSAMQSLRGIYVVQGRPVLSADLMVAAVVSSTRCEYWQPITSTATECTIETKRRGAPGPVRKTWTAEDAKRAGLTGKDIWKSYPAQMLRHRCAADLAREVFPDLLMGVYAQGEIPGDEGPRREEAPPAPQRAAVSLVPQPKPSEQVTPEPDPIAQMADEDVAALEGWAKRIQACASLAELTALGPQIKALPDTMRAELRPLFIARQRELSPPPEGPKGKPANDAGPDAKGAAAEGVPADDAARAWREHLATHAHPAAIVNSYAKHLGEFGLSDERMREVAYERAVAIDPLLARGWFDKACTRAVEKKAGRAA
jgi:hypothetical protein